MNKLFKIVTYGILLLLFLSCNNEKQTITINCDNTIDPIIVRMTREDNSIISINFPQKILLKNNSFFKKSFIRLEYIYIIIFHKSDTATIQALYRKNVKLKKRHITYRNG